MNDIAVLVKTRKEAYRELEDEIADERDERVTSEVPTADGTVVYVTPPEEIDLAVVADLQRRLVDRSPDAGAFSIVTGYTPESARDLYYRQPYETDRHWITLRIDPEAIESNDPNVDILTRSDMTVERLSTLYEDPLSSASMMIDGRTINSILTDGYVCGYPMTAEVTDYDGLYPNCIEATG